MNDAVVDVLELSPRHRVALVADADGGYLVAPQVADGGRWRRAVAGDGAASALVAALGRPAGSARFETVGWHVEPVSGERAIEVDQTNESVIVGERAVVKWSRVVDDGPTPERLIALHRWGFTAMPRPWGVLRWRPDGVARPALVATVVDYLPGAVDGWSWAVDDARAFAAGALSLAASVGSAAVIGAQTAAMHVALAAGGVAVASGVQARSWAAEARAELADAVAALDGAEGRRLRTAAGLVSGALGPLAVAAGTPIIDVHGDLHVGQVLRHGDPPQYAITDFDGNPVVAAEQRRARQPAAVDLAGLLQSFDHVGRVVLYRTPGVAPDSVTHWIEATQAALLDAYRSTLAAAGRSELLDESLLRPLRLWQVVREYLYAIRHLPHWRYVPDTALPALLAAL